jgi:hypothetical protein
MNNLAEFLPRQEHSTLSLKKSIATARNKFREGTSRPGSTNW